MYVYQLFIDLIDRKSLFLQKQTPVLWILLIITL